MESRPGGDAVITLRGHRLEYRTVPIAVILNRSYALCDMYEHWFEG